MTPAHLYIHVPFCLRRCSYCDFAVSATNEAPTEAWLAAIISELRAHAARRAWLRPFTLQTLYIGGGTPSLLGPSAMTALRRSLSEMAEWSEGVEWTAEANPETFGVDLATQWRRCGVNRISLGAQTFHEPALRWMGRMHGPDGPAHAMQIARQAGFDNVSLDLMFGLPARLGRDWKADLDRVLELEPDHISLYGLTAESATPLGRWVAEGREALATDDTYEAEYLLAVDRLGAEGFEQYEVSNFARPGYASRHNAAYWEGAAYLGLGPGAHSYMPPERFWNVRDWADYRMRLLSGESTVAGCESVDERARALERTWLGLRTRAGLELEGQRQIEVAASWERAGWAEVRGRHVRLTPRGWLLLDRLTLEMDEAGGGVEAGARLEAAASRAIG